MPQLDFTSFPPQLFWLAVSFVVLYALMRWVAVPRVGRVIDARQRRLDDDLARAGRLKAEAEGVLADYEKVLAAARAEAQATLRETGAQLAAEAAERQRALSETLAQQIDEAEQRIAAIKAAALAEVRDIAVEVGEAVIGKLTGAPPAAGRMAAAVDRVANGAAGEA
jgi:F-type H+-transporting ATPase subunit b